MRINIFSLILVLLITFGVFKTIIIIDKVFDYKLSSSINKESNSRFALIDSAIAGDNENKLLQENKTENAPNNQPDNSAAANIAGNTSSEDKTPNNIPNLSSDQSLILNLSSNEIKLLKELSKRRDELDKRESSLKLKENLLYSTEQRIDKQIKELAMLKEKVDNLLKKLDEKEDEKIIRLAKIYENMKPKDAARIFNQMEVDLIISILRSMRENKVAAIISNMNPLKAKEVSTLYSERNEIK